jgi:hypothetical protein
MQRAIPVLKALAIIVLAATGAGVFVEGLNTSYNAGANVAWGVAMLLGAAFLYRAWFWRA